MKLRLLVICNALDDLTRLDRSITTDSPAASRKIFMLCGSLKLAGVSVCVVSLGRGHAGGRVGYFPSIIRRVDGVPVIYMPFSTIPLLSELISLLSPLLIIFKLRKQPSKALIFYNRMEAYIPSLIASSFFGYKNILDLEDGEVSVNGKTSSGFIQRLVVEFFDRFCRNGALLACNSLIALTSVRPVLTYYGVVTSKPVLEKLASEHVTVLMVGTLCFDTGAELLIESIRQIRLNAPFWATKICVEVTGKGASIDSFIKLASEPGYPKIIVHGRITDLEYLDIIKRGDVGLALKLNNGSLAHTTFPSKVIEFAAAGLLVVTTDISDVRQVLGDGALYLMSNEPNDLIVLLEKIIKDRVSAINCAKIGSLRVQHLCSARTTGQRVSDFIFGSK